MTGGAGNPQNPNGYATSYLWEEVLQRDSLLDLIHRFISFVKEKEEMVKNGVSRMVTKEKMIFPRYHQYDVVRKLMADVRRNGAGQKLSDPAFGGLREVQFNCMDCVPPRLRPRR